jgi:ubiquinone/menaquinone biosynthesis C-methylase UbiE
LKTHQVSRYYDEYFSGTSDTKSLGRVRSNLKGMDIRPGACFVDVGCGLGATGLHMSAEGAQVFGLDISSEAVHRSLGRYEAVLQASADALPFADSSFDGATLMGTLEHFPDSEAALHEVTRTVRARGQVCLVVPNSRFFLFDSLDGTGQPLEEARTYEGWTEFLEAEGLEIDSVRRDTGPGVLEGGLLRGVVRKLVLLAYSVLPIRHTYQFVFLCRTR